MKPDTMATPMGYTIIFPNDYPAAKLTGLPEEGEVPGDAMLNILDEIRRKGWKAIKISGITGAINNRNGPPTLILDSGHDYITIPFGLIAAVVVTRTELKVVLTDGNSHTFIRPTEQTQG